MGFRLALNTPRGMDLPPLVLRRLGYDERSRRGSTRGNFRGFASSTSRFQRGPIGLIASVFLLRALSFDFVFLLQR